MADHNIAASSKYISFSGASTDQHSLFDRSDLANSLWAAWQADRNTRRLSTCGASISAKSTADIRPVVVKKALAFPWHDTRRYRCFDRPNSFTKAFISSDERKYV